LGSRISWRVKLAESLLSTASIIALKEAGKRLLPPKCSYTTRAADGASG
jgi:hypothetical protein